MSFLDKLERKFGNICIPNLMTMIVGGMFLIFLSDMLMPDIALISKLAFNKEAILNGEIWRVFTFLFMPESDSPIFIIFSCYFYYMIGSTLENLWGTFKFNVFYFTGAVATIIVGFVFGITMSTMLNMSLFLAFGLSFPDMEFLLMFVWPVKAKYMAYAEMVLMAIWFLTGSLSMKALVLASVLNVILFFGPTAYKEYKNDRQYKQARKNFRDNYKN